MSLELETCRKCGETYIFPNDRHTCKSQEERNAEWERDRRRRLKNGNPLSAEQAYHLFNWED